MEKRFDEGVVGRLARAVHTLNKPELGKSFLKRGSGIFGASIGMKQEPALWSPALHRPIESPQGQRNVLARSVAPTYDPAAVFIHDHGKVAVDGSDLEVGDVADPDLVGALEFEIELLVQNAAKEAL